ncbi:MAG: AMP-binding protein [Lachnospiraceae bacterium]|nr:AMP-binding protein [Lachnospiraceae bacterium]
MWNFKQYKEKLALIDDKGRRVSYLTLYKEQKIFAQKIDSNSLVMIICENTYECVLGYISCIQNKKPVIMVDSQIDKAQISILCNIYRPEYVWGKYEEIHGYSTVLHYGNYYLMSNSRSEAKKNDSIDKNIALLLPTSGSTGNRKYVCLSYKNLMSNARAIIKALNIRSDDVSPLNLPISYTYGISIVNTYLYRGASILLTESSILDGKAWDFFEKNNFTSLSGVPRMYENLERLKFRHKKYPSLRVMTQAGGRLNINLQKKYLEYAKLSGINFYIMYGQTEATARISCYLLNKHEDKIGSVGKAVPDLNISIDCTKELFEAQNDNSCGEVVVEGDSVFAGYAESRKDLISVKQRYTLHTGDIGYIDEDGYLYLVGRKTRFCKICGRRIELDDIESVIKDEFKIVQCAAVEKDGIIYIFIVNPIEGELIKKRLFRKLNIPHFQISIHVIKKIPHNSSGKIQYGNLLTLI